MAHKNPHGVSDRQLLEEILWLTEQLAETSERHDHEIKLLKQIEGTDEAIKTEVDELVSSLKPKLSFIKIKFTRSNIMAEGPVTLSIGQKTIASIDGFDQNGAAWTGAIPTPTWAIDDATLDTIAADPSNPANEDVTALAAGTANLTASLTTAEGKSLTDTEAVTNLAAAPVLSSIKINFSAPQ